jgi:hypothetical protein
MDDETAFRAVEHRGLKLALRSAFTFNSSTGLEFAGRGRGFTDSDPDRHPAIDPTRRQMRDAVRRAVRLILRAEDELAEAGAVIANGATCGSTGWNGSAWWRSAPRPWRPLELVPDQGERLRSDGACAPTLRCGWSSSAGRFVRASIARERMTPAVSPRSDMPIPWSSTPFSAG